LSDKKPFLILGVGNLLLKDEGVGVHVVRRLMEMDLPPYVEVLDGGTAGLDLIDDIEGREKVVFVDTVRAGGAPGSVYRMTMDDIDEGPDGLANIHDMDVPHLLKTAGVMGVEKPKEIVVIGIEPKDMESISDELSPEVAEKIPKVIEVVMKEVEMFSLAG
jgi:hydrogenase maturation protease